MKCLLIVIVSLISCGLLGGCITPPSTQPKMYVVPAYGQYSVGYSFNVSVIAEPVVGMKAWEVELSYNPMYLQYLNYTWGNIWDGYTDIFYSAIFKENNTLRCYAILLGKDIVSSSSGYLIKFKFIGIQTGVSEILIGNSHLYNATTYLKTERVNGTIIITY